MSPATSHICAACQFQPASDSASSLSACAKCSRTFYCKRECQVSHWPLHKATCSLNFTTTRCKVSGLGLRATVALKPGDQLFSESPIMTCTLGHAATCVEEAEEMLQDHVEAEFLKLSEVKQRIVKDLSVGVKWEDGCHSAHSIFQSNMCRLKGDSDGSGGLFPAFSCLNHSCRPNVAHVWRDDLKKLVVMVVRTVNVGDELCTTYGPTELLNTAGRRAWLLENHGFTCFCEMCKEGNSEAGDDRMSQMNELQNDVPELVKAGKYKEALEKLEEVLMMLATQGIGLSAYTRAMYKYGAHLCEKGIKDEEKARNWMKLELEALVTSEGEGPESEALRQSIQAMEKVRRGGKGKNNRKR